MKERFKKLWVYVTGFIPQMSPIGRTAFDIFCGAVLDTYGLPNTPGYRQAIGQTLMQLKGLYVSRHWVAKQLRIGQARQTAYEMMKEVQQQKAVASAPTAGGNNGSGKVQETPTDLV